MSAVIEQVIHPALAGKPPVQGLSQFFRPKPRLRVDPANVHVGVNGGVVRLEGTVERRSDADILPHVVRGLDGVVDSPLKYSLDDRHRSPSREPRIS